MLSIVLIAVLSAAEGGEPVIPEAAVEAPHVNVVTLDLIYLAAGEVSLGYERATSRYTSLNVLAGYRFGSTGTTLLTMRLGGDYFYHLGAAVRFYPLGKAPTQLFISPGVEARVGRETYSVGRYSVDVNSAAFITAGWAFHFFKRWALSLQGGVRVNSFGTFHNDSGITTANENPVRLFVGVSTGVAL